MAHPTRALVMSLIVVLAASFATAQTGLRGWQPGDNGSFRVFLGSFNPEGDSLYWDDKFTDFTGAISDFDDFSFNLDYRWPLGYGSSLLFGGGWYEGESTQAYRDWVDADGREIRHLTTLSTAEFYGAWIYEIGKREHMVTPYLGLGAGFLWWELEESGDFIDFGDAGLPIVRAAYRSQSGTVEIFALAGLDIRVSRTVSLVLQGRWREADDEMQGDLAGFGTLDLAGLEYAAGLAIHF